MLKVLDYRAIRRLRDKEKRQRYSRSRFWMRYLTHRLPGDGQGAICQLSCLEVDGPVPEAQSVGLSTQVWTSDITSDPLHPTGNCMKMMWSSAHIIP